uniref:Uncharacterized protein n=1 Tax=Caenorhabditis japonica TaxID=281687 RepID=A0A8R1E2M2_CAEJA
MEDHIPERRPFKLEIISSFALQMAVYFNLCIYPMHFINLCLSLYFKHKLLSVTYQVIAFSACLVHLGSEGVRLGLGFYGNLAENMSALFGFLITTIIIQIPLTVFLVSNSAFLNLPLEFVFYIMIVIFSAFQTVFAIQALKKTADREVSKYLDKIEREKEVLASSDVKSPKTLKKTKRIHYQR